MAFTLIALDLTAQEVFFACHLTLAPFLACQLTWACTLTWACNMARACILAQANAPILVLAHVPAGRLVRLGVHSIKAPVRIFATHQTSATAVIIDTRVCVATAVSGTDLGATRCMQSATISLVGVEVHAALESVPLVGVEVRGTLGSIARACTCGEPITQLTKATKRPRGAAARRASWRTCCRAIGR